MLGAGPALDHMDQPNTVMSFSSGLLGLPFASGSLLRALQATLGQLSPPAAYSRSSGICEPLRPADGGFTVPAVFARSAERTRPRAA